MQRVIADGLVVNPIRTTVYKNEPKLVPVQRRCQSFSRTPMLQNALTTSNFEKIVLFATTIFRSEINGNNVLFYF